MNCLATIVQSLRDAYSPVRLAAHHGLALVLRSFSEGGSEAALHGSDRFAHPYGASKKGARNRAPHNQYNRLLSVPLSVLRSVHRLNPERQTPNVYPHPCLFNVRGGVGEPLGFKGVG